jgi:DNA-directed RNA polymerase specialized sigma24 family protein
MKGNLFERTEGEIESLRREAARVKTRVEDAFDDGVAKTRRRVKRYYQTAEDLVDDTALRVRRHPFASLALSFGAGALTAWFVSRKVNGRAAGG